MSLSFYCLFFGSSGAVGQSRESNFERSETIPRVSHPMRFGGCLFLSMLLATSVRAADDQPDAILRVPSYCGIYCVYGALKSVGVDCQFSDFLSSKYVTSSAGSSLAALQSAVESKGAFAEARTNLTATDLMDAPCPVVLHFADERRIGIYNHWVLYLGTENGMARIVDAPHQLELMPYAELLARWDSIGLFISKDPIASRAVGVRHILTTTLLMGTAGALALLGYRRGTLRTRLAMPLQVLAICGGALVVSVLYHLLVPTGLLRNATAVELVQQSHLPIELPEVSEIALASPSGPEKPIVVDARFEDAFEQGHVPGALNIPLSASRVERLALLQNVAKDQEIVIYCETSKCAYAELVGRSLFVDGFKNVRLYPEGWRTWASKHKPN